MYYHGLITQPDCHKCPLRLGQKVLPDGPIPARICFVGEGPGYNEVIEGRGFVGPSGQLLWHLAESVGISRDQVWISNSALCMPRDVKLSTGAVIKQAQVKWLSVQACHKRLVGELLTVTQNNPDAVIVPLGNLALATLSGRKGARIYAYRGSLLQIDLQKLWNEACQQSQNAP